MSKRHTRAVKRHIQETGTESMKCDHLTSKSTLTHALVVMQHPAGLTVKAFVVLWPGTFLTWVVARYRGWQTDEETVIGSILDDLKQNSIHVEGWDICLRYLHRRLCCRWSFFLWSSRQHSSGTDGPSIQDHRHTLHLQGESPPPRSGPGLHTHHRGRMDTLCFTKN